MPEEPRRKTALIAAALSITLAAGVAAASRPEPPAERRLTSGAQAGYQLALLDEAPPPDRPPALPSPSPSAALAAPAPPEATRLTAFDACGDLLDWIRGTAERLVTPDGLPGQAHATPVAEGGPAVGGSGGGSTGAGGGAVRGGDSAVESPPATSATNVQEAGVDEPDVAKHSGELLVAVAPAGIHVVHVAAQPPRLLATLPLPRGWGHQLLLHGSRLLVTSTEHEQADGQPPAPGARFAPQPMGRAFTLLTTYDLADPSAPRPLGELRLEGALLSSREHDGLVRVVLRGGPTPPFVVPRDGSREAERDALERNREIVRTSSLRDWLPASRASQPGRTAAEGPLSPCARVLRTNPAHSLDMVTVATVSLSEPLRPLGATSLVGAGDIVYATAKRVFVTHHIPSPSEQWPDTGIHAFDTSDALRPRHIGSAAVKGLPLNQWALSEHDGHLRVATTEFRANGSSESAVRVLAIGDGVLREVGAVGGLGKGERIFAVRYDGTTAYVVTFRQTDPLYTLDLSDPARPRVTGELKIPGFSRYLHPIGGGLLLGIGQDAGDDGRQRGLQVSVFDVRDPAKPRRVSQVAFGENSHSAAEHDHHALLWWAPLRRLVVPLTRFGPSQERDAASAPFDGAVSVAVDGQGQAAEAARLDTGHGGERSAVRRVFARGDAALVLTDGALIVAGMDRMEARSRLDFPPPAGQDPPRPEPYPAEGRPAGAGGAVNAWSVPAAYGRN